jgi:hypothetical protein
MGEKAEQEKGTCGHISKIQAALVGNGSFWNILLHT